MRTLWLIDGSYLFKCMRSFQDSHTVFAAKGIDYLRLKRKLAEKFKVENVEGFYFNSTPDPASDSQNAFHSWLKIAEPQGPNIRVKLYDLKDKKVTCRSCGAEFTVKVQKGVDVGIATTAIKLCGKYDAIILSAGDGDFEDFIRYLAEDKDLKLYIAGFTGSVSPDIQQYSSKVLYLDEIYSEICDNRNQKPFDAADEFVVV